MGGAAGNVFQGQRRVEREGFFPLSLSLSLHMQLLVDVSPTHSDRLCFSLSRFKWGLAGILCQSAQRQTCQNSVEFQLLEDILCR